VKRARIRERFPRALGGVFISRRITWGNREGGYSDSRGEVRRKTEKNAELIVKETQNRPTAAERRLVVLVTSGEGSF